MRKEDITRLEALEIWIWRRTEKISWTEHISNEVLKLVEEERSLLTIIRTRQRNWMRHIMRGDSLQREIIKRRMEGKRGKRSRGRQRKIWMDNVRENLKEINIDLTLQDWQSDQKRRTVKIAPELFLRE